MKKISVMLAAGAMIFLLFLCGQAENTEDMQTGTVDDTAEISQDAGRTASNGREGLVETASDEKEGIGETTSDEKEDIGENVSDEKDTDKTASQKEKGSAHEESEFIDYEALGIKEYEYPAEFVMGDDLKTAIAQLALSYTDFDSGTPGTGGFKEFFIAEF